MDFTETVKALNFLGLSEYEARVYISLVTEGASEGRKLSIRCGVPRTKVYTTLKKLMERGLVFELPEVPRKFAPASPAKAFETYLLHLDGETSSRVTSLMVSREAISLLEQAYKKTQFTAMPQREEIWIVQGRAAILKKVREMLPRAEKGVTIVTTEDGFVLFYKTVGKILDRIVDSGVKVWIGTSIGSNNRHLARELNYMCKVENIEMGSPFLFLCIDNRECLLADVKPGDLEAVSSEDVGVVCRNSCLCRLISLLIPGHAEEVYPGRSNEAYRLDRVRLLKQHSE